MEEEAGAQLVNEKSRKKLKRSETYTYQRKHPKRPKKKQSISWGLLLFEAIGWIVLAGAAVMVWYTSSLISIITDSTPVTQLTKDMTGIVRLEGEVVTEGAYTEEGVLQETYALLQKEPFRWECSRSGCDFKLNDKEAPAVWGSLSVNGQEIQADRYQFYSSWLPLDYRTVEPDQVFRVDEIGSSRPLLVKNPKSTAYGYHAVSSGDWITVIGQARNGRLQPFTLPGSDHSEPVILVGDHVDQMISKEKGIRTLYMIIGTLVMLLLFPVTIRRLRNLHQRISIRLKQRAGKM